MWLGDIGSLNGDFSIGEMEKFFLPGNLEQIKHLSIYRCTVDDKQSFKVCNSPDASLTVSLSVPLPIFYNYSANWLQAIF